MDIRNIFNNFNYITFNNFYKPLFLNYIFSFKIRKKREILRQAYLSNSLLDNFFKKPIDYEKLRMIFYNKDIFAYIHDTERDEIIEYLNKNHANQIKEYIKSADKVIKREFTIFEKNYKFEKSIQWNYGFFDDFYWNFKKSESIDIYPKNIETDVKYVWEFNRHQFLPYLGFAYYMTNNEKYAIEF